MADPKKIDYRLGRIEGKLSNLNAKMDMVLLLSQGEVEARMACREHCDKAMPALGEKVDSMRWKVACVAGAELGLLGALIWVIKAHVGG